MRLTDYFRCPDNLFEIATAKDLSAEPRPFSFGGARGWGPVSALIPRNGSYWNDVSSYAVARQRTLQLPFDAASATDNLLFERYVGHIANTASLGNSQLLNIYYLLRPYLPTALRRLEQRAFFLNRHTRKFPQWPVDRSVDELFEALLLTILRSGALKEIPFVWFWPEGHPGCVILTHDVETRKGRDLCPELMDLDEAHGIRSSFQLVPETRYSLPQGLIAAMRQRGFEINVHDLNHDGKLFIDHARFLRRAAKINRHARDLGARGFRSAVLYRNQEWYGAFDFEYDMSVPNAGHLEVQFGGCCTVMPYWVHGIVELPLTTMQDYVLFTLRGDYSLDLWKKQVELIRQKHGLVSFLAHPDYSLEPRARAAYEQLLDYIRSLAAVEGFWLTLPGEVNDWWRLRSQMQVVQEGSSWRIEGRGAERARLAFARLRDDKLVCDIVGGSHGPRLRP